MPYAVRMLQVVLWVALWVLLLAFAGAVLFVLGRSAYRKSVLLLAELEVAADRFSRVGEQLQTLAERPAEPAVFDSPTRLRQQRYLDRADRTPRTARTARSGRGGRTMARKPAL